MRTFVVGVLVVQVLSFVALGGSFFVRGVWRLGVAQLLLAVVTAVIYSDGVP